MSARTGWGIKQHKKKKAKSYSETALRDKRAAVERIKNGKPHYPVPWVDV